MKIELNLNRRQLDVLLSTIEIVFATDMPVGTMRGPELPDLAMADGPGMNSYDHAMLAPTYKQLVGHWTGRNCRAGTSFTDEIQIRFGEKMVAESAIERELKRATDSPQ